MIDVELYGGKFGYLEHLRTRSLYALGVYRGACEVEWTIVSRLVFVCKGNICRSPYASARARMLGVPSISFGLSAADGVPADRVAVRNAQLRGVDLSPHLSANMESCGVTDADLIVAFEPRQIIDVSRHCGTAKPQITLLGVWGRRIRPHIQDPYGRNDRYFRECFSIIDNAVVELVSRMTEERIRRNGAKDGAYT